MTGIRLGAFVLGAGASSRMGQPKLLLPWASTTIIGHLLDLWRSVGTEQIAVVCAPLAHPLHAELNRLRFPEQLRIINPEPGEGMFSSILSAARWTGWVSQLTHFAMLLGDQPQICKTTIETLLSEVTAKPDSVWQPAWKGRPKHPVILPRSGFQQLASTGEPTMRAFLHHCGIPRSFAELDDDGLAVDLDTPDDYTSALRQFKEVPSSSKRM